MASTEAAANLQGLWATVGRLVSLGLGKSHRKQDDEEPSGRTTRPAAAACRRRAIEAMLKGKGSRDRKTAAAVTPLDAIAGIGLDLRLAGEHERADFLDNCVRKIRLLDEDKIPSSVLSFLLLLSKASSSSSSSSAAATTSSNEGHPMQPFLKSLPPQERRALSPGPFLFGEIKETATVRPYTHYSSKDFRFVRAPVKKT